MALCSNGEGKVIKAVTNNLISKKQFAELTFLILYKIKSI